MAETGLKSLSVRTVEVLLKALENADLKPVVARNYEDYPNFGHDLDLFVAGHLNEAVSVFKAVAKELEWDRLTLCDHYAAFGDDTLRIPVFRFHLFDPLQTLQVDLFGALLLWGLALSDRHQICARRQLEPKGRFHTMPPEWEQGYRLFQIQNLHPVKEAAKRERYRQRVITFDDKNSGLLRQWGEKNRLGNLAPTIKALRTQDDKQLNRLIRRAKARFVLAQLIRHPLRSILRIKDRKSGLNTQFKQRPCGPLLRLSGNSETWTEHLDYLVENQALAGWSSTQDRRERGWAWVTFEPDGTPYDDQDQLLRDIFDRHEVIHSSTTG